MIGQASGTTQRCASFISTRVPMLPAGFGNYQGLHSPGQSRAGFEELAHPFLHRSRGAIPSVTMMTHWQTLGRHAKRQPEAHYGFTCQCGEGPM